MIRMMKTNQRIEKRVSRFLDAWLAARQIIQAANFNRFQSAGLSATQFMTLNLIPSNKAGMTLTELSQRMNLGVATLAKTVDSLELRSLLTRTRSKVDHRQVMLALTSEGKSLHNSASMEFHDYLANLFNRMSAEQRDGLVNGLEGLVQASMTPEAVTHGGVPSVRRSSPQSRTRKS
ncbi:MAG: MarR family transcriptional regulator [Acidobacteriaceae bacterium]